MTDPKIHFTTDLSDKTNPISGDKLLGADSENGLNIVNIDVNNLPISSKTQTALNLKVDKTTTINGHALSSDVTVTKSDIGLGNVDNTSDANKPISTATQTALNAKQNSLGYTPEDVSNKDTSTTLGTSDTKYPSQKAVKTYVDTAVVGATIPDATSSVKGKLKLTGDLGGTADSPTVPGLANKVTANVAITGATKTKITYDEKGLVTSGADATTADIADSTNKRYVTDANLTVIGNTSGTNTGDNATNSQYSGLATSKQDTLVSGTNIKSINGSSILGSGDLTVSGGHTIQDEGTSLTQRTKLNFVGTNVTVTDDSGNDATVVTVTGGGGSGDVTGPGSSTDGNVVLFNGATGKIIKDSGLTLSGTNTGDQDLSGLVPYTGATGNVDLGTHNLDLNKLHFVNNPTAGTLVAGDCYWNNVDDTLDIVQDDGTVLQVGQEQQYPVKASGTLTDGTLIMASGTDGNSGKIVASSAVSDGSVDPKYILGISTKTTTNGNTGKVTTFGAVRGIQTNGANYSESWSNGDVLYPNPNVAGGLTKVLPTAPAWKNPVAIVISSHASNGTLWVRIIPNHGIGDLEGVDLTKSKTTPVDADVMLLQDSADSSIWKKLTWANTKATLKTYFDTLYQAAGSYLTSANIDDTAYDATSWDGVTTIAPSKNAVRDKFALVDAAELGDQYLHGIESWTVPTWSDATKILTIPACTYWYQRVQKVMPANTTVDLTSAIAAGGANKTYFVYFTDANGTITVSTTAWTLSTNVTIVTVYWNGTTGAIGLENHGPRRDIAWHTWAHLTIGTRYQSGLSIGAFGGSGTGATWSFAGGTIYDEDIPISIGATNQTSPGARVWYPTSASTSTFVDTAYPFIWNSGTSRVRFPNASYTLTDVGAASFINIFAYATNDKDRPIYFYTPSTSATYTSVANARAASTPDLSGLGLSPEWKLLYRIVVNGTGALQASVAGDDYRLSSTLPGGGTTIPSASGVTYTPTTPLTSTNVQGALDQIAGQIVPPTFWQAMSGTPTRASNTTFTVTGDVTSYVAKGMIIKWTESSTIRVGMVSIPSTYSAPNTTITIIGDTMASIDAGSLKYCFENAQENKFAVAGSIGATGTDVANAYYAKRPERVIGADLQVGTAGTTNNTTVDINKAGTTMFTVKPTLATTVAASPLPFTADTATSLALNDKVTIDIDAIQTTRAVDLYVTLYTFPTYKINLT